MEIIPKGEAVQDWDIGGVISYPIIRDSIWLEFVATDIDENAIQNNKK
jgi:hypothetical protein